jgi:hypothetical protein
MNMPKGLVVALALLVVFLGSSARAGSSPAASAASPTLAVTYYFLPG